MGNVIVINWLTLDGVMQGPGRPDEDTRDGFSAGGWAAAYSDDLVGRKLGEQMGGADAWLFGRRTYDDLLASWNEQGGPFADALNERPKYVATRSSSANLKWPNSVRLGDDVTTAVADLKARRAAPLVIMGSGELIAALMSADLIDEYLLLIAPLVLGRGRRLFAEGAAASLRLTDCVTSPTGVVIGAYSAAR